MVPMRGWSPCCFRCHRVPGFGGGGEEALDAGRSQSSTGKTIEVGVAFYPISLRPGLSAEFDDDRRSTSSRVPSLKIRVRR